MLKRLFDIVVALLFLVALSPLFATIAILIKLESKGPVLHRAVRIGRDGRPFTLYKFRTMVVEALRVGPKITRRGDPRITRLGRSLRRYRLDEMPQFINVLKGEMSMVGPRPEDPRFVAVYTPEQRRILSVRPGMASPATLKYRDEEEILAAAGEGLEATYLQVVLPDKLCIDLEYIDRPSVLFDFWLLVRVGFSLFFPPRLLRRRREAVHPAPMAGPPTES